MLIVFKENNCSYMVTTPILTMNENFDYTDLIAKENLNITGLKDKHTIFGARDVSYGFDIVRTNKNKVNPKVSVENLYSICDYIKDECEARYYGFSDKEHSLSNKYAIANNEKIVVIHSDELAYEVEDYEILDDIGNAELNLKPLIAMEDGSLKYRVIKALREYLSSLDINISPIIMVNTNDKAIEIIDPSDDIECLK